MSTDPEALKRRYREFLDLLPLAINLAGLPTSDGPYNFTPDQIEVRASTLAIAFRQAQQLARTVVKES